MIKNQLDAAVMLQLILHRQLKAHTFRSVTEHQTAFTFFFESFLVEQIAKIPLVVVVLIPNYTDSNTEET